MPRVAYNRTDRPVVIDRRGRTLEGRGRATVDEQAPEVIAGVAAGRLVFLTSTIDAPPTEGRTAAEVLAAIDTGELDLEDAIAGEQARPRPRTTLLADLERRRGSTGEPPPADDGEGLPSGNDDDHDLEEA